MLDVIIRHVGRIRPTFYQQPIESYLERLQPYAGVDWQQISAEPVPSHPSSSEVNQIKQREAERLEQGLPERAYTVALHPGSAQMTTHEWARWLQDRQLENRPVAFLIGGPVGLHRRIRKQADRSVSLSSLTFPHALAVLVLTEQLYRAFKIIRGEPYHY